MRNRQFNIYLAFHFSFQFLRKLKLRISIISYMDDRWSLNREINKINNIMYVSDYFKVFCLIPLNYMYCYFLEEYSNAFSCVVRFYFALMKWLLHNISLPGKYLLYLLFQIVSFCRILLWSLLLAFPRNIVNISLDEICIYYLFGNK